MDGILDIFSDSLTLATAPPGLTLVEIMGSEREALTELMARLAVDVHFEVIPGGEWLPDQANLRRALRMHTPAVNEGLARIHLMRPFTCLQVVDLLAGAGGSGRLLLVLDFLHHFYNTDVDLALRLRVLEQCSRHLRQIARMRPVAVFLQYLPEQEYEDFLPYIARAADEVLRIEEILPPQASQPGLFEGFDG